MKKYDRIIIGAGIYGLYAASKSAERGLSVAVIEADNDALRRGSFVNQARLHSGYHYPRSKDTAKKSRDYFFRFMNDFSDAIYTDFKQLYAIAHKGSLTTAHGFEKFCADLEIKCDKVDSSKWFKPGMVDGTYDTLEYAIDRDVLASKLLSMCSKVDIYYGHTVDGIDKSGNEYVIYSGHDMFAAPWVLNATYAGTNQIASMLGLKTLPIKYEICEILLCAVTDNMKHTGLTVMDGPFFSVMPFGKTGLHSLTAVEFTPHETSWKDLPDLKCQKCDKRCAKTFGNCNMCIHRPDTAWKQMYSLAKEYVRDDIDFKFVASYFAIKPILTSHENDDGRPTIVMNYKEAPGFYTVFSGKLNTIYDLDSIL